MGEPVHSNGIELEIINQLHDNQTPTIPDNQVPTDQIEQDKACPEACMVCRRSVKIEQGWTNLQPGDHIEKPIYLKKLRCRIPIKHHAIVAKIEKLRNGKGLLSVIDVPRKIHGTSKDFTIESHMLKYNGSIELEGQLIKKVEYKCRRHTNVTTLERAQNSFKTQSVMGEYCFCLRNCEHFAVYMVCGTRNSVANTSTIKRVKNVLQPGDHIEFPNHHHAIIQEIENISESKAKLTTIGLLKTGVKSKDITTGTLVKRCSDEVDYKTIKLVYYKDSKINRARTLETAMGYVGKEWRNHFCDDFAFEMVYLGGTANSRSRSIWENNLVHNISNGSYGENNTVNNSGSNISDKLNEENNSGSRISNRSNEEKTSGSISRRQSEEKNNFGSSKSNPSNEKNITGSIISNQSNEMNNVCSRLSNQSNEMNNVCSRLSNPSNGENNSDSNINKEGQGEDSSSSLLENRGVGEDSLGSIIDIQSILEDNLDSCIDDAVCLQSGKVFWIAFHTVLSTLQCAAYFLNFYIYAMYAQKNENFKHGFGNTTNNVLSWCYTGSKIRGFTTHCDWLFLGVLVLIYLFCYGILLRRQSKTNQNICLKCKVSARLIYLTKFVVFILMEIVNIFAELWIYKFIEWINSTVLFTIFFIIMVTLVELIFGFFIAPNLIVKRCFLRQFPKCKGCCPKRNKCCLFLCCCPWDFDEDSYKYFNHYG